MGHFAIGVVVKTLMASYDAVMALGAPLEKDLIQRILTGESDAFGELVREHHAQVIGLCRSILGNSEAAEDAAQEAFLKGFRNLKSFRGDAQFSTWMYRIAYRHCLDVLKSQKRRYTEPLEVVENKAASGSITKDLEFRDMAEKVLSKLSPEYRLVLTLREVQGLSYEEIANATDSSLDSVKARLKRARQTLLETARHFETAAGVQMLGDPQ